MVNRGSAGHTDKHQDQAGCTKTESANNKF
jgi:hypothetical protein